MTRAVAFKRFRAGDVRSILATGTAAPTPVPAGGASMAITAAATLAGHLAGHPDDPAEALQHYEQVHRRRLRAHHIGAPMAAHLLVPSSPAGIIARDTAFRACSGAAATARRIHPSGLR